MNEVGAKENDKNLISETSVVNIHVHIGVFFDGTNNNANNNKWYDWFKLNCFVEKDHALNNTIVLDKDLNISNPAILSSLFISRENNMSKGSHDKYLHVYIEGSGANGFQAQNQLLDFAINGKPVKGLGFGLGSTGVVAKVSKAIKYIGDRIRIEEKNANTIIDYIHFYVFGFSRGSTCSRLFSYIIARNANDEEEESIGILDKEKEFDKYLSRRYFKKGKVCFLNAYKGKMTVDFLGIYDTVSAIGFLKEEDNKVNKLRTALLYDSDFWGNFHKENVKAYGLYSPTLPKVLSTCHICAMDEFRANFALTDIGSAINDKSIELFIPGCHSDIGGGYTKDSKAEIKTLLKSIDNRDTQMCINHPTNNNAKWELLSIELLKKMGWITNNEIGLGSKDKDDGIEFIHTPKPENQYSNIALKFMYERALLKAPELKKLFSKYPDDIYPIPKDLEDMYKAITRFGKKSGRYCYLFKGYSSTEYKKVREKYLHFTSTDTLHSIGDIGNPPGRKVEGTYTNICRLIYHGDKNDANVHYMQDYNSNINMINDD